MKLSDADIARFKAEAEAIAFGPFSTVLMIKKPAVIAWAERDKAQRAEIERLKAAIKEECDACDGEGWDCEYCPFEEWGPSA